LAKLPSLKERAGQADLLNQENHAFMLALEHLRKAQDAIDKAMDIRQRRKVALQRPETKPSPEVLALEEAEQRKIARVKVEEAEAAARQPEILGAMEAWQADTLKHSEPKSRLVRSARCLLRQVDEILRGEVRRSAEFEDVPWPWEQEFDIYYRLAQTEAGIESPEFVRAAAKVEGGSEALRKKLGRIADRAIDALSVPREYFAVGLMKAFEAHGKPEGGIENKDLATLDDLLRRALVLAWASPALHEQVARLFPTPPGRTKRKPRKA
jgi:hypothetical protein